MNAPTTLNTTRRHPLENRIPPPLSVLLIGVSMAVVARFTPDVVITSNLSFAAGGFIIALGAWLVVRGARTFWRHETTIDPVAIERASRLVTSGVFRFSRNPMYVGFAAVLVGWAAFLGSPWTLFGPVVFILFTTRFQIVPEEGVMLAKFGREFEDYRAQVRRWV